MRKYKIYKLYNELCKHTKALEKNRSMSRKALSLSRLFFDAFDEMMGSTLDKRVEKLRFDVKGYVCLVNVTMWEKIRATLYKRGLK